MLARPASTWWPSVCWPTPAGCPSGCAWLTADTAEAEGGGSQELPDFLADDEDTTFDEDEEQRPLVAANSVPILSEPTLTRPRKSAGYFLCSIFNVTNNDTN